MLPNPAKPIFRIAVVRFTPMHNAVDECAVRIFYGLRDYMRGFEMIVPKQNQCANELLFGSWKFGLFKPFIQSSIQFCLGLNACPWPWPEFRRLRRGEQFLESVHP